MGFLNTEMDRKLFIFETALKSAFLTLNEFLSTCMDENGEPKVTTRKALMRVRRILPAYCDKSITGDGK